METIHTSDETIDRVVVAPASGNGYQGPDRRRPGRPQEISPHLVALLRSDERRAMPVVVETEVQRATVGIGVAVLLSVPLWAMLGVILWALFA